jgi:DNA-binding NarL/FixJ family response regulator
LATIRTPVQQVRQQAHDVRVVVANQSLLVAEALGRLLDDLGLTVVATASDPETLLSRLADGPVDVLVLDANFHPTSGALLTLERMRAAAPGLSVVVIADAVDEALSVAARDGDLDGVVLASAHGAELAAAVAQVVAGHAVFPAGWLRQVREAAGASPLAQLSPRQREVLELLALGMDNDQIAARLYISRNTVKFHVRTIYERLGVHNRVEATRVLASAGVNFVA